MKYVLDTHTHTIASGHAYSTVSEMISYAKQSGLSLLSITDHAPMMPGSCHAYYFHNLKIMKNKDFGIPVLFGTELNILDTSGTVDLDEPDLLQSLDIKIASLHLPCFEAKSARENTDACIQAMQNPAIDIIGHPDDARIPLEYERLVMAAKKYNVALELNNSSQETNSFRKDAAKNARIYLELCKKYKVLVSLGSDAHFCEEIGNFSNILPILSKINFPDELILNTSVEKLMNHLKRNKA